MSVPEPHIPAHVPPSRVRDVDLYNVPGASEDVHLAWKRVQDECPSVFFTPRHGGYWVITRAELLDQAWPDHERFSSDRAIGIPRQPDAPAQLPIELDPPVHRFFRHPLNMALRRGRTGAVGARPRAEHRAHRRTQAARRMRVRRGLCRSRTYGGISVDRGTALERSRVVDTARRGHDARRFVEAKGRALQEIFGYLESWLKERREQPGDDLISRILQVQVGDRPISHEEALSECALVLFGGLTRSRGRWRSLRASREAPRTSA